MSNFRFNTNELTFTKSETKIINYIYEHLSMIPYLSIIQISNELNISIATISRFVRHTGYESYKDLKAAIMEHENVSTPAIKLQKTLLNSNSTTISKLIKLQEKYLEKTIEKLSEDDLNSSVYHILNSENIYLFGKGSSVGLAELCAFRLKRFNKNTFLFSSGGSTIFEDLVNIRKGDLIILFGFYKMPVETKVIITHAKEIGCNTILFTDQLYLESYLKGNINFYVYRGEINEYHSMTAPTALIDAIVIMVAKKFEEDSVENLSKLYRLKEKYKNQIPR